MSCGILRSLYLARPSRFEGGYWYDLPCNFLGSPQYSTVFTIVVQLMKLKQRLCWKLLLDIVVLPLPDALASYHHGEFFSQVPPVSGDHGG